MPVLQITFKPKAAPRYKISWKRSLAADYALNDFIVVLKQNTTFTTVNIVVPVYEAYDFKIEALCVNGMSVPFIGVAIAPCLTVTGTAVYETLACPKLTDIVLKID